MEQIIETLRKKNLLKGEHLQLLVTPQLQTLNLIHCCSNQEDILGISEFFHLTSIRCLVRNNLFWILFSLDLKSNCQYPSLIVFEI